MARSSSNETAIKNMLVPVIQAIGKSGKLIYVLIIGALLYFGYTYFYKTNHETSIESETNLIQAQVKNVGKLVVTEGHFAEVFTFKDSKKYMGNLISFDKKALVVINADVTVSFDLSQLKYDILEDQKLLVLTNVPKEEIKIAPDIKYYDTESSSFNEFTGSDYNKISNVAKERLRAKIEKSTLKTNAKNRLVTELSKMLILTNSLGWTLMYDGKKIAKEGDLDIKLKN